MGVSISDKPPFGGGINLNVLIDILGANETVQARITAFEKAKNEADEAFARLQIGKDAKKAFEDANAKYADLQEQLERATKVADETVQAAQVKAETIMQDTEAQRAKAMAEIASAKKAFEDSSAVAKDQLQAAKSELKDKIAEVTAREAAAAAARDDAVNAIRLADISREEAEAEAKNFKAQAAKLQQALSSMGASGKTE